MGKLMLALAVSALAGAGAWWLWQRDAREDGEFQKLPGEQRIALARKSREGVLRRRCAAFGLPYPPREIFLRAFKNEAQIEVWAREDAGRFDLLHTYPVLAASGGPGPKRREGDRQVPEGFYFVDRLNPESSFHLSLGLDYPNASDRILSDPDHPGSDIFIHGKKTTIGCLPIGDAAIEELYLLALDTRQRGQREIPVHLFPARMSGAEWERFTADQPPALVKFWAQLQPAYDAFERTRRIPAISVDGAGRYLVGGR